MSKPDRAVPGYAAALASSLRWDGARDEPYLQLPSFPDLRLVPYRPGIADDLVSLVSWHRTWPISKRAPIGGPCP